MPLLTTFQAASGLAKAVTWQYGKNLLYVAQQAAGCLAGCFGKL